MEMARDSLLPSFFSKVNMHTQVPVKSTILTSLVAATLSFCMDVEQLAGMCMYPSCIHNGGNFSSDTSVCPPDEVPLPSSLQAVIDLVSLRYSKVIRTNETDVEVSYGRTGVSGEKNSLLPKNR
ncbi:hypothetical protein Hanom_Chr11g01042531 [Helianthus anomalus]